MRRQDAQDYRFEDGILRRQAYGSEAHRDPLLKGISTYDHTNITVCNDNGARKDDA